VFVSKAGQTFFNPIPRTEILPSVVVLVSVELEVAEIEVGEKLNPRLAKSRFMHIVTCPGAEAGSVPPEVCGSSLAPIDVSVDILMS
jgi:hypothetical protein